jgi:hypothetical protein
MSYNESNYNIPNEQTLLIDILNTMYNDNIRQINILTNSNNEIRNLLTNVLFNSRPNVNYNRYINRDVNRNVNRNNRQNPILGRRTNLYNYDWNRTILNFDTSTTELLRTLLNSQLRETTLPTSESTVRNNNANVRYNATNIFDSFFEPINIFPTPSQIETATRNILYSNIVSPRNRSCPISLETFNDNDVVTIIRFCGHIFNTNQLNTWFQTNCRCPVCRYDIRSYNINRNATNNSVNHSDINQNETTTENEAEDENNTTLNYLERDI